MQPSGPRRSSGLTSIAPRISNGVFRLSDGLTLTTGSGSNLYVTIDRSITQFAESKTLIQMYDMLRLIAFEARFTPYPNYVDTDAPDAQCVTWVVGTNLAASVTGPPNEKAVLACSDSKMFNSVNRVSPFTFKSLIPRGGYLFTTWEAETENVYSGCPGAIQFANLIANSAGNSKLAFQVSITGIYELTARTFVEPSEVTEEAKDNGKITRLRELKVSEGKSLTGSKLGPTRS